MNDPLGIISSQNASPMQPAKAGVAAPKIEGPDFKQVLMQNINQVNKLQQDAEMAVGDLAAGRADMESVMVAKEKADIAFKMLLQVRNKLMDAYEEVKQIRV